MNFRGLRWSFINLILYWMQWISGALNIMERYALAAEAGQCIDCFRLNLGVFEDIPMKIMQMAC